MLYIRHWKQVSRATAQHSTARPGPSRPGQAKFANFGKLLLKVDGRVDADAGRQMTHTHTHTLAMPPFSSFSHNNFIEYLGNHPRQWQRQRLHSHPAKTLSEPPKLAAPSLCCRAKNKQSKYAYFHLGIVTAFALDAYGVLFANIPCKMRISFCMASLPSSFPALQLIFKPFAYR